MGLGVLEGIDERTGKPYYYYNNFQAQDFEGLPNYDSDWEYLMEVVEKIEDFHTINGEELEFQVVIYEDEVNIIAKYPNKRWETIVSISADGSGKKENTYKAVVQFIEWYNNQK